MKPARSRACPSRTSRPRASMAGTLRAEVETEDMGWGRGHVEDAREEMKGIRPWDFRVTGMAGLDSEGLLR